MSDPFQPRLIANMSGVSVMLAMPLNRDMPWQTAASLLGTQALMIERGIPFEIRFCHGCSLVEIARTRLAHEFLEGDKTRLFWVDSDIQWRPEDFLRMLALSTRMEVVAAAYPAKVDAPTFLLQHREDMTFNDFGCVAIEGIGMGFMVVGREVIQALAERAPKLKFPQRSDPMAHIFRCDADGEKFRGEDMAFCADVRALGFDVHVDPTIRLGHIGAKTYTGGLMDAMELGGMKAAAE